MIKFTQGFVALEKKLSPGIVKELCARFEGVMLGWRDFALLVAKQRKGGRRKEGQPEGRKFP